VLASHLTLALSLVFGLLVSTAGIATADDEKKALAALRAEADRCLKLKKKEARLRIGTVLLCADRFRESGDPRTARQYLKKIVKIDPWAMEAHVMLAEVQKAAGEDTAVEKKTRWILEHAESGRVRSRALRLAGSPADATLPSIAPVPGTDLRIVLIPIGPVDALLLKAAAEKAMRHVNFPVLVQDAGLHLPPGGDDPLEAWTARLREAFRPVLDTPEGRDAFTQVGKSPQEVSSDEVFHAVYRAWLERTGKWRELSEFDARLDGSRPRVWRADDMNRHLATVVGAYSRDKLMYVGMTRGHMLGRGWRGGERPAFGWGGGGLGTVSYGPLFARQSGEKPSWDRLVARTAKQVICVIGSTLEVGRCRDRKCPMRVVVDLKSLDAKGFDPCPKCADVLRSRN